MTDWIRSSVSITEELKCTTVCEGGGGILCAMSNFMRNTLMTVLKIKPQDNGNLVAKAVLLGS